MKISCKSAIRRGETEIMVQDNEVYHVNAKSSAVRRGGAMRICQGKFARKDACFFTPTVIARKERSD